MQQRAELLKAHATKTLVTEKRMFAGQEVEVKRLVVGGGGGGGASSAPPPPPSATAASSKPNGHTAPAAAAAAAPAPPPKKAGGGGGLESVLEEMKGPETISTVAKSSYDWDTYKAEKGLDDELAQVTKDGYLNKKDFLVRRFVCVCVCAYLFLPPIHLPTPPIPGTLRLPAVRAGTRRPECQARHAGRARRGGWRRGRVVIARGERTVRMNNISLGVRTLWSFLHWCFFPLSECIA